MRAGRIAILLQPDRGSHADRKATYHDMTIPPRHAYVALYGWLRDHESIDALVHLGTHGTLEWLPGKALALSSNAGRKRSSALAGDLSLHRQSPGRGCQAKRRLCAVTIGHLTPPLTAGGLHGAMAELEALVKSMPPRMGSIAAGCRCSKPRSSTAHWSTGLAAECGLVRGEPPRQSIAKLDARLCDIKDLSVRDGLHVFGRTPEPQAQSALVAAIETGSGASFEAAQRATIESAVAACATSEREALLAALDGHRVRRGHPALPAVAAPMSSLLDAT